MFIVLLFFVFYDNCALEIYVNASSTSCLTLAVKSAAVGYTDSVPKAMLMGTCYHLVTIQQLKYRFLC